MERYFRIIVLILYFVTYEVNADSKRTNVDIVCTKDGFFPHPNDCKLFYWCSLRRRSIQLRSLELSCLPNEIFDTKTQSCTYPWLSTRRECGGNMTINEIESPTYRQYDHTPQTKYNRKREIVCTIPEESFLLDDCQQLVRCVKVGPDLFLKFIYTCHNGKIWDHDIKDCNYPHAVKNNLCKSRKYQIELSGSENRNYEEIVAFNETAAAPSVQYSNQISQISTSPLEETNELQPIDNDCTQEGFLPNSRDCKKFYRCVYSGNGKFIKYEFSCGLGTVWDTNIQNCNYPWAAKSSACSNPSNSIDETSSNVEPSVLFNNVDKPNELVTPSTSDIIIKPLPSPSNTPPSNSEVTIEHITPSNAPSGPDITVQSSTANYNAAINNPSFPSSSSSNIEQTICKEEGFTGDPINCKKFYRCVATPQNNFISYEFTCGEGTVWDEELSTCNYPGSGTNRKCNVGETTIQNSTATEQSASNLTEGSNNEHNLAPSSIQSTININESPTNEFHSTSSARPGEINSIYCTKEGFFVNPIDCKKFYRCVDNEKGGFTKYDFTCGKNTAWDSALETCNYPSDGSECNNNNAKVNSTSSETNGNINETDKNPVTNQTEQLTTTKPSTTTQTEVQPGTSQTEQFHFTTTTEKITQTNLTEQFPTTNQSITDAIEPNPTEKLPTTNQNVTGATQSNQIITGITQTAPTAPLSTTTKHPLTSTSNPNNNIRNKCLQEGFYPNLSDCNKFIRCVDTGNGNFIQYDFNCGPGTIWDPDLETCNYPHAVQNKKCKRSIDKPNQDVCTQNGFYPDSLDCKKFYRCVSTGKGTFSKYDFTCGEGTAWDQQLLTCNYPEATSCGQSNQTSTEKTTSTTIYSTETTKSSEATRTTEVITQTTTDQSTTYYPTILTTENIVTTTQKESTSVTTTQSEQTTESSKTTDYQTSTTSESSTAVSTTQSVETSTSTETSQTGTDSTSTTLHPTTDSTQITSTEYVSTTNTATESSPTTEEQTSSTTELTSDSTTKQQTNFTTETSQPTSNPTTEQKTTFTTESAQPTSSLTTEQQTTESSQATSNPTTEQQTTESSQQTSNPTTQQQTTESSQPTSNPTTEQQTSLPTESSQPTSNPTTEQHTSFTTESSQSTSDLTTELQTSSATVLSSTTSELTTEQTSTTSESSQTSSATESTQTTITESSGTSAASEPTTSEPIRTTTESNNNQTTPCPVGQLEGDQIALVCPTGFKRHPKYCNLFYQCTTEPETYEIKVLVMSCPNDTIYDDTKIQCLPPEKTDQKCNAEIANKKLLRRANIYSLPPMDVSKNESLCSHEGSYPYDNNPEQCDQKFIKCQHPANQSTSLKGFIYQCPIDHVFWTISKKCERFSKVLGCNENLYDIGRWNVPTETENI